MADVYMKKLTIGSNTYTIPIPTKISELTNDRNYTDNIGTITSVTTTAGSHTAVNVSSGAVNFNVPTTAAHVGIKFGYTTNGNNRAVLQDNSGNLYVTQKDDNTNYYHTTGTWSDLTYTATANGGAGALAFTIPTGTSATTVALGNHSHGNITNGGDITATAPTIANGDQIVINDHSESKITNGPTFDGSTTTKALTPKGTWETFLKSYTETDPVFTASAAAGITNSDITNWNGKTSNTGTVTSVTLKAGGGISLDTDDTAITTSGTRTISHKDTSSQATVTNTGRTYIQSITLDTYGHVTNLESATETVTNTDEKIKLTSQSTSNTYPLIFGPASITSDSTYQGYYNTGITVNPNTKTITATTFVGALTGTASGNLTSNSTLNPAKLDGISSNTTKFLREDGTWAVPAYTTNTDTKVNVKKRGTTKAYLLGTITSPTDSNQAVESVAETGVYFDTTAATLVATTFKGSLTGTASGNLTSDSTLNAAKLSGTIPSSCYTNSNTTYTLANALSDHKYTWTFTAGGSGSGSTTTSLELVAGNGISLTDDATNKKITIAYTGTSVAAQIVRW